MKKQNLDISMETAVVRGEHHDRYPTLDLTPPIHMTSAFQFKDADHGADVFAGRADGYVYTRMGNPTIDLLQEKMALLEEGEAAVATASGMAAVAAVALTLARTGDNFISCTTIYGGTYSLFNRRFRDLGIEPRFITPSSCTAPEQIEQMIDSKTRFLFLETPANPTMEVLDIEMWAAAGRRHGVPLLVDNTFATPYLQQPLRLGAEAVIHSATKYIGGHGDLIGGIVVGKRALMEEIDRGYIHLFGPCISPFNAWLALRGIRTLAVRVEKHSDNAMKVARWLDSHLMVEKVHYPGLESHPCHAVAAKQMKKFGGMLAFEVKGGIQGGKAVMNHVRVCTLAVSLGDCETLIQHPASMTHSGYSKEDRKKAGITDGLIRLSVGIEDPGDIIADLDRAFSFI